MENKANKTFEEGIDSRSFSFGLPEYTIREVTYEDAEVIYRAIDENRSDLRTWLPFVDALNNIADEQSFLESILKVPYETREIVYIVEKGTTICGLVGFHFSDYTNHRTELGYWLLAEYRGKGIITQAVQYLCHLAIHKKGINRIQIRCAVDNIASNNIPERLGFTFEGTEREGQLLTCGKYTDIHIYGLLKSDIIK